MPRFELCPIKDDDLSTMGQYMFRASQRFRSSQAEMPTAATRTAEQYEAVLRWRAADNPARVGDSSLGVCIRRDDGAVVGVHFFCPLRYRLADRLLRGLISSSLFVDEEARHLAFFLFKRALTEPGYDFYGGVTCNSNSGPLWAKCGGHAVPHSDGKWFVPVRYAPLMREAVLRKGWNSLAVPVSAVGKLYDCAKLRSCCDRIKIKPTDDLELVADMSERYRNLNLIMCNRDLDYLRWMYVDGQAIDRKQILRCTDDKGRSGWFSVSQSLGGIDGRIRMTNLLDWAIPPDLDLANVISAYLPEAAKHSDVFVFHPRPDLNLGSRIRSLRWRNYLGPTSYLIWKNPGGGDWQQKWVISFADRF